VGDPFALNGGGSGHAAGGNRGGDPVVEPRQPDGLLTAQRVAEHAQGVGIDQVVVLKDVECDDEIREI